MARTSTSILYLFLMGLVTLPISAYEITTLAGGGTGVGHPPTASAMTDPIRSCISPSGIVYISDPNTHRVYRVTPGSGLLEVFAGNGTTTGTGMGGLATDASVPQPCGLAVDASENLYICDRGVRQGSLSIIGPSRILRVDAITKIITVFAGGDTAGSSGDGGQAVNARLAWPSGIAFGLSGELYIADQFNSRIRRVAANGIITTIAGGSLAGYNGDGGPAINAQVNEPNSICVDAVGNIHFCDELNATVRYIDTSGIIHTEAGQTGVQGFANGPYLTNLLNHPGDIKIDSLGRLIIADAVSRRVRRVDGAGVMTTIAGIDPVGKSLGFGIGGPPTSYVLGYIWDVNLLDAAGNQLLLVDNSGRRMVKFDLQANTTSIYAGMAAPLDRTANELDFGAIRGVLADANQQVYFTDQTWAHVVRLDQATGKATTIAGTGEQAVTRDGFPGTQAGIAFPNSLVLKGNKLYIGCPAVIRALDLTTNIITRYAGTGSQGSTGDEGPATAAKIGVVSDMKVSPDGEIYLADELNHVIRRIDSGGTIHHVAGSGASTASGDSGPAATAGIPQPRALVFLITGDLLVGTNAGMRLIDHATGTISSVGDTSAVIYGLTIGLDDMVYYCTATTVCRLNPTTWTSTVLAGTGTVGFNGDQADSTLAQVSTPVGISIDANGHLVLGDSGNRRLRTVKTGITAPATVSFTGPTTVAFSGSPQPVSLALTGNHSPSATVAYQAYTADPGTGGVLTGSPTATPPTLPGWYHVTAILNAPHSGPTADEVLRISPKNLTVGGIAASDRDYDGTTSVSLDVAGAMLQGVVAGDVGLVSLVTTAASGSLPTADAGPSRTVTVAGLTLSGSAASHYLLGTTTTSVTIHPATATVIIPATTVVPYDGATHAVIASTSPTGLAHQVTYDGSVSPPSASGTYTVIATITDSNYTGQASGLLSIAAPVGGATGGSSGGSSGGCGLGSGLAALLCLAGVAVTVFRRASPSGLEDCRGRER